MHVPVKYKPLNAQIMKRIKVLLLSFLVIPAFGQQYTVLSPDNSINVTIEPGQKIIFKVLLDREEIITASEVAIDIEQLGGIGWKVKKVLKNTVDNMQYPVVHEKSVSLKDQYNEIKLLFQNKMTLTFRTYNNGIAYRWESMLKDSIRIIHETSNLGFHPEDLSWYPIEKSFYSHNERLYKQYPLNRITHDSLASLPALVVHSGINILISEADLYDYPGMWITGNGENQLRAVFSKHAAKESASGDRDVRISQSDDFMAETIGTRTFPWRVFILARKDANLLDNTLVYQLSRSTDEDYSWVKPGKVAWDWWNALNVDGVDFKSGVNTATYKYYIDFASKYGLDYIILDEGWSPTTDITKTVSDINMPEILSYAREKNVGVILWVLWTALDRQIEEALDLYASWGIKGVKVDFMQRDDQKMVNFYERTALEAAKRKLLVDFHGAFKPTGLEHKYPNVITREGVYGLEQSKWDNTKSISPEHNVTLPFIRNVVGPMDYTPGAMLNAQRSSWNPVYFRPVSLGTRCHQLAMYVIYTSPLQMLSDAPSNYYREPECMDFLSTVPVVWDETVPLDAKVGDFVVLARKAANGDWYLGAMTDWSARDLEVDLNFLGEGNYVAEIWEDGINADRNANDFARRSVNINASSKISIHLAPGGGWVAHCSKVSTGQ
jgi:alpha-glucosidase